MNVAPHINPHNLSQNPIFPQKVSQLLCPSGWYKRTVHWSSHYFSKFKHRHRQHGFSLQKELITWHVCYRQFALCLSVSLSYVQISDVRIRIQILIRIRIRIRIQIFLGWIWIRIREKKGWIRIRIRIRDFCIYRLTLLPPGAVYEQLVSNPDSDSKQLDSDSDSRKKGWIRMQPDLDSRCLDSDSRCLDSHITGPNASVLLPSLDILVSYRLIFFTVPVLCLPLKSYGVWKKFRGTGNFSGCSLPTPAEVFHHFDMVEFRISSLQGILKCVFECSH